MKAILRFASLFVIFAFSLRAVEPNAKPVIVLVHGAWGGGWQFRKIEPLLQARGYVVYRPTLTGLGERTHLISPSVGLETHIEDIVNLIRFEKLNDIILIGHSYGGMVITGVAERVPERISKLIYLDALLPENGENVRTVPAKSGLPPEAKVQDGVIAPWWIKPDKPYPKDVPQPAKTFTDPISIANPAAAKIPGVYILTVDKGKNAADDDFAPSADRARKRHWPVLEMEGDHNPYWFQPEATAEILDRACHLAP